MADYDVQALGLASPPASAPVTTYYPGVTVRNNGVHPANVTGYVRQYDRDTGLLLATYDVTRANLAAGATAAVSSTSPLVLLPADIGRKFLFQGFVTCDRDSVPANNYFGPVEVVVTGETPPPPPIDEHHTQHENGGADELNLDGLPGKLAENQEPTEHASAHQDGGADQLDVDGLSGELAEPQTAKAHAVSHGTGGTDPIIGITPGDHATSHENGGGDELSVAGLSGQLAEPQEPNAHATHHEPGGTDQVRPLPLPWLSSTPHSGTLSGSHGTSQDLALSVGAINANMFPANVLAICNVEAQCDVDNSTGSHLQAYLKITTADGDTNGQVCEVQQRSQFAWKLGMTATLITLLAKAPTALTLELWNNGTVDVDWSTDGAAIIVSKT